ncbi:MAG: VTT domain-containing protein, partial [Pseudomonadales bacterium]|nr:VTT domain-containing protein [Pseudomonadales bacterium]
MTRGKILLIALFLVLVTGFFVLDLGQYLTLDYLKARQSDFQAIFDENPLVAGGIYFLIYVAVTAVSLPGAAVMTVAAGALFGLWWGVVIVSFASTIGATLAMLAARFIFREQVRQRFRRQLDRVDKGIEREGAFYLFTLRLVPAFPFFAINLVMGLTNIAIPLFFVVSQVGMLAGTIVYVNAGTQLGQIESPAGILSPELIISFTLLGLFPLIAKKIVDVTRARKMLKNFDKPKAFDRDVVVIGAGSGGLVAALIAATVKAKVTLIEKDKMGGDCLNSGCVPSKSLIRSAKLAADMRRGPALGFRKMQPEFDFADIMERVQGVIRQIEPHDSVER